MASLVQPKFYDTVCGIKPNLNDKIVLGMKKNIFVVILLIFQSQILNGCFQFRKGDELLKFKTFQFSFQDLANSKYFSILFLQNDTIYLKKNSDSKADTLFYAILPSTGRSNINMFIKKIDSLAMDSCQDFDSGDVRFSLYLDYGNEKHNFFIHSLHPPMVFKKFNNWVNKIIDSLKFNIADTSIEFVEDKKVNEIIFKRYPYQRMTNAQLLFKDKDYIKHKRSVQI